MPLVIAFLPRKYLVLLSPNFDSPLPQVIVAGVLVALIWGGEHVQVRGWKSIGLAFPPAFYFIIWYYMPDQSAASTSEKWWHFFSTWASLTAGLLVVSLVLDGTVFLAVFCRIARSSCW